MTCIRTTLALALASLLGSGGAQAQDSGVGVDFAFGSRLENVTKAANDCDPRGMSWLRAEGRRSPTGARYICAPEILETAQGDWLRSGHLSLGWLSTSGDVGAPNWLRYSDWDDGPALGLLALTFRRPYDGTYVELRASRTSSDNQYLKATVGRAGKYRVEGFARSQPNVMSTTARSVWSGVGTNRLTLVPGLVPGASRVPDVAAASAAAAPQRLQVTRDKQGVGVNYFFTSRWTGYFSTTNEERQGARAFGGPFFFNFPFPANGGIFETPRPIDDATVNVNGGLRYVGNQWRMDLAYTGSFYRDSHDAFTYENPYALWAVVPGATSITPLVGEFATEPDNDYHNVRATFTRKLAMNGELSFGAAGGTMRQNEALLPPTNCTGMMGIDLSPLGSPVNPYLFDCADWNTPASLSRQSAGMRIDTTDANVGLVLQPTNFATYRATLKFRREDYRDTYVAYNPITGQYGYVAENGAMGAVVPGEMGIWDPFANARVPTRVRSLALDKETRELALAADFRLNSRNTFGAAYTYTDVERTHREVSHARDHVLKLTWVSRAFEYATLRANYQYLRRSGSDYVSNPYEHTLSMGMPGFGGDHTNTPPHTVDALRKYDVGGRTQHKATLIASVMPSETTSLNATLRGDWNDYRAELGRQSLDTYGFTVSWDWQPTPATRASAFVGWDKSSLGMANVNDAATVPEDPTLGGAVYPEASRWWVDDDNRSRNAGATFDHDFGRVKLDAGWNFVDTRGLTGYRYASVAALAWPTLAEAGLAGRYPELTYRTHSLSLGLTVPIRDRWSLRLFDLWERGRISDWHYQGLEDGLVIDHRIYLDAGQRDYRANLVGLMLEVKL